MTLTQKIAYNKPMLIWKVLKNMKDVHLLLKLLEIFEVE